MVPMVTSVIKIAMRISYIIDTLLASAGVLSLKLRDGDVLD